MNHPARTMRPVAQRVVITLCGCVLLTSPFIDLEASVQLGPWLANAPIADIAALLLIPAGVWCALQRPAVAMPALPWAALVAASTLSLVYSPDPVDGAHAVVRRIVFPGVAYGVSLAAVLALVVPARWTQRLVLAAALSTAVLSISTSVGRVWDGQALWWTHIHGITPNHKTLAVVLAGCLPMLLGIATSGHRAFKRPSWLVFAACILAIILSMSKTAWLGALIGVGWFVPRARPLSARPAYLAAGLALGIGLLTALPLLSGSRSMLDAARSRHSLNVRAWQLFSAHPVLGSGPNANLQVEAVTFPDYRVNGVDAHGVIQKVSSELGVLGLAPWLWFTLASGRRMWRRRGTTGEGIRWGCMGSFMTLHVELLLSTETFSTTHWAPLAVAWGLSAAHTEADA